MIAELHKVAKILSTIDFQIVAGRQRTPDSIACNKNGFLEKGCPGSQYPCAFRGMLSEDRLLMRLLEVLMNPF